MKGGVEPETDGVPQLCHSVVLFGKESGSVVRKERCEVIQVVRSPHVIQFVENTRVQLPVVSQTTSYFGDSRSRKGRFRRYQRLLARLMWLGVGPSPNPHTFPTDLETPSSPQAPAYNTRAPRDIFAREPV